MGEQIRDLSLEGGAGCDEARDRTLDTEPADLIPCRNAGNAARTTGCALGFAFETLILSKLARRPAPRSAVTSSADDWWRASNVGSNRAGTLVPESFDLSVAGQKFSVHSNATKHMAEYARSTGGGNVPMSSFAGAVEQAAAQGLRPGRNFVRTGSWELGIDTNGNVIYHAVYQPG